MSESIVDDVLHARYYQPGEECWDDVAMRVATYIGDDKTEQIEYYKLIKDKKFIPNSPCLMNAGTDVPMMSACFSIGVEDSMDSILRTFHNAAIVMKYGGGVGIDFSHLRPKNALIESTGGTSSGPIEFMKLFDSHVETIKQGGKRRGAAIATMDISHPDILDFIGCKTTEGVLSNMNISVRVSDAFMEAVEQDRDWNLEFNGRIYEIVKAKDLYQSLIHAAWKYGEPGIIFIDEIKRFNPYHGDEYDIGVNPCCREGTYVRTPKGDRLVETIDVGDEISTISGSGIVDKIEVHEDIDCYRVCFDTGDYVDVTPSHQLLTGNGFERVDHLRIGRRAFTMSKHGGMWFSLITDIRYLGKYKVYDLHEPTTDTWITNNIVSRGCGETNLMTCEGGGESCNLGSIDVSKYYDSTYNTYDSIKLKVDVHTAIQFLDKVIDKNFYPVEEIEIMTKKFRRLGLGIMGWHDLLIKMGIPYDSPEALEIASELMQLINNEAANESIRRGKEIGTYCSGLTKDEIEDISDKAIPYRNIARTCIAPTGSIATIAGCSYGIEPIFSLVHMRYTWADGEKRGYKQIHPIFKHDLFMLYPDDEDKFQTVIDHAFEKGTIQDLDYLPPEFREKYKTALDIPWQQHIKMQAAFQKYVDNNISKTVNLPPTTSTDDVGEIYMTAWKSHLKGLTIYRSGSRENEVLELKKEDSSSVIKEEDKDDSTPRPQILNGSTYKMRSGCGKLYITINERNGRPYEVFVQTAGSGGCQANSEAIGRLISICLRNNIPPDEIIKQLRRVKCAAAIKNHCDGKSCADIIANCLKEYFDVDDSDDDHSDIKPISSLTYIPDIPMDKKEFEKFYKPGILTKEEANPKEKCPECGEPIVLAEGCLTCPACGWSKCK